MLEIKAIGIGGIGCALLPFLCRYLQYSGERARVTLITSNLAFGTGLSTASSLAE